MSVIVNSANQNNPMTVAQGGSGTSSWSNAYGLIIGGTSPTNPFQTVSPGSAGQMYVSAGNAAAGTLTAQNAIGTWQLLSTVPASNTAAVQFTGLTTAYSMYKILISNLVPITNAQNLVAQFSTNNGSSWLTGSSYTWSKKNVKVNGVPAINNNTSTGIVLTYQGYTTTAGVSSVMEITFINPDSSLAAPGLIWQCAYWDNGSGTPNLISVVGQGYYNATQATNAIQLFMNSGNISSGTFNLYGLLI